jgi:hypothetical protein
MQGKTYSCGAWWNGYELGACVFLQATSSRGQMGVEEGRRGGEWMGRREPYEGRET